MKYLCRCLLGVVLALVCINGSPAWAGTRPQVDLSVSVSTTPAPFEPGGIVTATMTVHNAGPDVAGATLPGQRAIAVFEDAYDITNSPPPYLLFEPATGCSVYAEATEPIFPGPHFFYLISLRFDPVGSGETRTCTYRLQVGASTQSFDTSWLVVTPNDDDLDPANNRFDYAFVAAPTTVPTVPSGSLSAWIAMALGMLAIGVRRQKGVRFICLDK